MFDYSDGGRISSVINNLKVFSKFSVVEMLFGKGLGEFFPYQLWMTNREAFSGYNTFYYEGQRLLVQPHNTLVYVLMESGLIGLTVFGVLFYRMMKPKSTGTGVQRRIEFALFLIAVLMVFFFESTAFVAPGSASLWWFVVLLFSAYEFAGEGTLEKA